MKKVLKIITAAVLLAAMVVFFAACNRDNEDAPPNVPAAPANVPGDTPAAAADLNIFLISHSPPPDSTLDDGSFNQGAADGIRRFTGQAVQFMQPHAATDEARMDIFADAIAAGADVLVLPGFHFQDVIYEAQRVFPDTYFIVLDTGPRVGGPGGSPGQAAPNLVGIVYAEQESGFLAGYAAVRDGFTELGFMGGLPVPAVIRFGLGFLQGAEHAAAAMGLAPGSINVNYMYVGGFGAAPEHTATANGWYAAGTEVIFVAAGAVGFSVMEAASVDVGNRWVIGVDVDQGHESETVLTSAMKALDNSVYNTLTDIVNGRFPGGDVIRLTAAQEGVALPMATSRFRTFSQAQYDAILNQLATGAITVADLVTSPLDPPAELQHVIDGLNILRVNVIG